MAAFLGVGPVQHLGVSDELGARLAEISQQVGALHTQHISDGQSSEDDKTTEAERICVQVTELFACHAQGAAVVATQEKSRSSANKVPHSEKFKATQAARTALAPSPKAPPASYVPSEVSLPRSSPTSVHLLKPARLPSASSCDPATAHQPTKSRVHIRKYWVFQAASDNCVECVRRFLEEEGIDAWSVSDSKSYSISDFATWARATDVEEYLHRRWPRSCRIHA